MWRMAADVKKKRIVKRILQFACELFTICDNCLQHCQVTLIVCSANTFVLMFAKHISGRRRDLDTRPTYTPCVSRRLHDRMRFGSSRSLGSATLTIHPQNTAVWASRTHPQPNPTFACPPTPNPAYFSLEINHCSI